MAQVFEVVRRAVVASAFVPDAMRAMGTIALSLILIRALGLG
jgi:hypothetical protein